MSPNQRIEPMTRSAVMRPFQSGTPDFGVKRVHGAMKPKHTFLPVIVAVVAISGCVTPHYSQQVPKTTPGQDAFFECSRCHSVYGGVIYANGSKNLLQCWTPAAPRCVHEWVSLDSRRDFAACVETLWPIDLLVSLQPPAYYWMDSTERAK